MPTADLAATPATPPASRSAPAFAQFPTAWRFALRRQHLQPARRAAALCVRPGLVPADGRTGRAPDAELQAVRHGPGPGCGRPPPDPDQRRAELADPRRRRASPCSPPSARPWPSTSGSCSPATGSPP